MSEEGRGALRQQLKQFIETCTWTSFDLIPENIVEGSEVTEWTELVDLSLYFEDKVLPEKVCLKMVPSSYNSLTAREHVKRLREILEL